MNQELILALDQGTTGTTAGLLSRTGDLSSVHKVPYPQIYPKPGWVEQDPERLWQSVVDAIGKATAGLGAQGRLVGVGIANQRETVVAWEKSSGRPLYNAIVWQCRRTAKECAKLAARPGLAKKIQHKTGLRLDPYFSASKMQWLLKHVPAVKAAARKRDLCLGTIDAFMAYRLSGGKVFRTDVSNASRTLLLNLTTQKWDQDLLKLFGVPLHALPEVGDTAGVFGKTHSLSFLPDGVPLASQVGDQQSALFGQVCFSKGEVKCTFGTGSFLLMNVGAKPVFSKQKLLSTIAWRLPKKPAVYALEGSVFICGAAVQWLRDNLGLIQSSGEMEGLASQVDNSDGVDFVPALVGLGAPYWRPEALGIWTGLHRGSKKAHLARATLDAMALQNVDLLMAMEKDQGHRLKVIKVDGGGTVNNLLMQLQSDYMGVPVVRPRVTETTVLGAGLLAGFGIGWWSDLSEIKKIWKVDRVFRGRISPTARRARLRQWHVAVSKA